MINDNKPLRNDDDIIDLVELSKTLFKKKWIIIITTAIFSIASVFYSLSLQNIYKSEAVLAPVNTSTASQISSNYSGLASLAGINIPNQGANRTQEGIKILESYRFFEEILKTYDMKPNLLAISSWDEASNVIEYNPDIYNALNKEWLVRPSTPKVETTPTNQEAFGKFDSIFDIKFSDGFIYLSIEHESPFVARDWLFNIIKNINELVKNQEKQKALDSINFLNAELEITKLSETKQVLSQLIQKQIQTVMLAEVSDEYLFKVIDPPFAPEERFKPNRKIICIFGAFMGFMFGLLIAIASIILGKRT
jgi:LPS O-antigen subunit length determinant protein (WzzB/FepE family)